jgi:hypothetical protein
LTNGERNCLSGNDPASNWLDLFPEAGQWQSEGQKKHYPSTLNATFASDPDMPQGEVAEVQGMISYTDGFTGTFYAILEKEEDD